MHFFDHGYRVPEDVAVVGAYNYSESEFVTPSLSTIDFPLEEMVSISVDTLINKLSGNKFRDYIEINSMFIQRESSKI